MNEPLISVCIPTRDRARWLGEALDSVFQQTLQGFEIVVCDDASRDDTPALVGARRDPRLRYLRHSRPLGVAASRNACLAIARGRYVAWLDSDDRYHPHMLAVQSAALERRPRAVLAHGGLEVIDEEGRRRPDWPPPFSADAVEPGLDAFAELVLRNEIAAPTVLVRRSIYERVGGYDTRLATAEDWEMWLRLALHGDLVYSAAPLAQYRWHAGSLARSAEAAGKQLGRDLRALSGVFARYGPVIARRETLESRGRAALAARALRRATDCLTRGSRLAALAALRFALRVRPSVGRHGRAWQLLAAALRGDEYRWHVAARAALQRLLRELDGSRMAERLRPSATPEPAWEETLRQIARTVRAVVPGNARLAVVDKWDPTLLHLSRRRGWHFPDRRTMPDGYPPDDDAAISHLEGLRRKGATHLVLPCSAWWWLQHYPELARRLETDGGRVWRDGRCAIYALAGRAPARHPRVRAC